MTQDLDESLLSTRPYLLRAFYDWIVDNNLTPHILVMADRPGVVVPAAARSGGGAHLTLNIGPSATQGLHLGNDLIAFGTRFAGVHHDVEIPVEAVVAIYARENGQGVTFVEELPAETGSDEGRASGSLPADGTRGHGADQAKSTREKGGKPAHKAPHLTLVKD